MNKIKVYPNILVEQYTILEKNSLAIRIIRKLNNHEISELKQKRKSKQKNNSNVTTQDIHCKR